MFSLVTASLAAAAAVVLWTAPGYALARRLGFDRALALATAPALGWAVQTASGLVLAEAIGLSSVVILGSAALIAVSSLVSVSPVPSVAGPSAAEDEAFLQWWIVPVAAVLAVGPALAVLPKISAAGVSFAPAIFDHSKIALIDEMLRAGVPPVNPFYGPVGEQATVSYYYLWHFGAAQLARLVGATGWEADAAATWFTAFSTALLMVGLARRLGGSRLAPVFALALCATGSLRPSLESLAGPTLDRWLAPPTGLAGWLFQTSWSPHHVAAAGSLVVAVLLAVHLTRRPDGANTVVLGLVMAAAFQSSIWVGGVVLPATAVALAPILIVAVPPARRMRFMSMSVTASLVALAVSAPLLLAQFQSALGRGGSSPIVIHPYEVLRPMATGPIGRVLDLPAYWLVLLVVEFPLIYIAGVSTLFSRFLRECDDPRRTEDRALAALAAVSLSTTALLVSTVGENNDLGWRAVLPGLIVLTGAAAAGLARMVERRARFALTAPFVVFAASLPAGVDNLNTNVTGERSPSAAAFLDAPQMWAAVRRHVPPEDRVASNPALFAGMTPWSVDMSWALLADRRSCFAGSELALAFVPLAPERREAIAKQFSDVFEGRATSADIRALAERLDCRAVLITARDGAWANDPFAASPFYRLVEAEPNAWRIYRTAAPAAPSTVRSGGGELRAQSRVLPLEVRETLPQRLDGRGDLPFGEARRDMLGAVPVERREAKPEDALRLRLVIRNGDAFGERRVGVERDHLGTGIDLQARATWIVDQEQAGTVVRGDVAGADVLAVAAIVGKGQCAIVDHLQEAGRTTAVLHIGPSGLGHGRHVEAVAFGDESDFVFGEPVGRAAPSNLAPQVGAARLVLDGPNTRRHGDVEKAVRHDGSPRADGRPGRSPTGRRIQAASDALTTGKSMSVFATSLRKLVKVFSATSATISTIWADVNPAARTAARSASLT